MKKAILALAAAMALSFVPGCSAPAETGDSMARLPDPTGELNLHISPMYGAWMEPAIAAYRSLRDEMIDLIKFPIRTSCVPARLKDVLNTPASFRLELDDGGVIDVSPLTEDVQKDYESAYQNLGHAVFGFGFIANKTSEYLKPYYNDEKSIDACINDLTNAMEIYISE